MRRMGSNLKLPPPNRLAAYMTSVAALLAALAPAIANLDLSSTVGVLGGAVVILGVFREWLKGWREHELRTPPLAPPRDGGLAPERVAAVQEAAAAATSVPGSSILTGERAIESVTALQDELRVLREQRRGNASAVLDEPEPLNARAEVPPGEPSA